MMTRLPWVQEVLKLVKKTTFWEFRVDYVTSLGAALRNARYVEVLTVEVAIIADAISFMAITFNPAKRKLHRVLSTAPHRRDDTDAA